MERFNVFRKPHDDAGATASLILSVCLALFPATARAGKLEDTRAAARDGDGTRSTSGASYEDGDDDGDVDSMLLCLFPLFLPFCIASWAGESDDKGGFSSRVVNRAYFVSYPFADFHPGHLVLRREGAATEVSPEDPESRFLGDAALETRVPVSAVTGRLSAEYYYDWDSVHVPGLRFIFDSTSRFGVDTGWRLFLEPLEEETDTLVMGHLNLTIRLLQHPSAELHLGLGGRLMTGGQVSGGFNGSFRFTLFPVRPVIVTMDLHMGNLGYAFFLEGEAAVGVSWRRLEWRAGYRGTLVSGRELTVGYHGPMTGITLWF